MSKSFLAAYDQGPWSIYGNAAYSRAMGNNIISAQFNFALDELAYIAQHYIHLDHDQTWTASAGAAYSAKAFLFGLKPAAGRRIRNVMTEDRLLKRLRKRYVHRIATITEVQSLRIREDKP